MGPILPYRGSDSSRGDILPGFHQGRDTAPGRCSVSSAAPADATADLADCWSIQPNQVKSCTMLTLPNQYPSSFNKHDGSHSAMLAASVAPCIKHADSSNPAPEESHPVGFFYLSFPSNSTSALRNAEAKLRGPSHHPLHKFRSQIRGRCTSADNSESVHHHQCVDDLLDVVPTQLPCMECASI